MNHVYFIISWMYECYSDVADFLCVRIVSMVLVVILILLLPFYFVINGLLFCKR